MTTGFIVFCVISIKAKEKTASNNILENTQWQGITNIPSPESVIFQFTKDLFTIIWNGNALDQTTYKFTVLNDKLNFEGISEGGIEREEALGINNYSRILP